MKKMSDVLRAHGWLERTVSELVAMDRTSDAYRDLVDRCRELWVSFRQDRGFVGGAKLLTYPEHQKKLGKSETYTVGLTLQHANVAGIEMCQWRTKACTATCVLDSGNGRYGTVQSARNVRTEFLQELPDVFAVLLFDEISRVAAKHDDVLVRLNVNSDIPWHELMPSMFQHVWDNVRFYDYTKNPAVLNVDGGMVAPTYRVVFSVSERDRTADKLRAVHNFVSSGGTAAVVTVRRKDDAPATQWMGLPVVDGDAHDDRFSESGVIVDLYAKGKARQLPVGGFVRDLSI